MESGNPFYSRAPQDMEAVERERNKLKGIIQAELSNYLRGRNPFTMTSREEKEELRNYMNEILNKSIGTNTFLRRFEIQSLIDELVKELTSLGVLSELLEDDTISEIMVNGYKDIWVERKGILEKTDIRFKDEEELYNMAVRIARNAGRNLDLRNTMVDAMLPDKSRVNIISRPNYLNGVSITIRKYSRNRLTIEDLLRGRTISVEVAKFLHAAVVSRANVLVSGGTNTGKTTFLNVLSNFIPKNERVVTIEDTAELQLNGDHVLPLETTTANAEGEGEVTMADLLKNTLRMNPSRILLGEVRDQTAYDLLESMNTGHDGSMSTIHANSPRDCLVRINMMVSRTGFGFSLDTVYSMIGSGVDLIVQIERQGNYRYVSEIAQTYLNKRGELEISPLYKFDVQGVNELGEPFGRLMRTDNDFSEDLKIGFRKFNIDFENGFNERG